MYIVDFSGQSIRYIRFTKSLLGKYEVKVCGVVDRQESDWKDQLLKVIKNQKIAIVIPEESSSIVRFQAPHDAGEEQLASEVEQQIAHGDKIDDFAFDCGIKKQDSGPSEVLCLAARYQDLAPIFSLVQECDAKPTSAVPESLAIFRILKDGIIEGEVILLIDIEKEQTHFIFYDATGPIEKKSVATQLQKLDTDTQKALDDFTKQHSQQINRIVLNGYHASQIEPFEFRKSVNILTIKAEDVLKDRLTKLNLSFECGGENVGQYLNAIATGLLSEDKASLNLVKNDVLMNVEKYTMDKKEELASEEGQEEISTKEKDTPNTKDEKEKVPSRRPHLTAEPIDEEASEKKEQTTSFKSDTPKDENTSEAGKESEFKGGHAMSHTIGSPDSQFRSSFRAESDSSSGGGKKKIFLFVIVALIVAIVAGIGLFFLGGSATAPQSDPTPTQEPTPSPTPTPELDREDLSLQVLNGSGEAGLAGVVAASLEDLGYQDGIDTGNADSYDYEETVIQLKEEFADYFDMLKSDLENEGYAIGNDYETLEEEADYDGVIIVGSLNEDQAEEDEEEEVTPTPEEDEEEATPTPEEEE